MISDTPASLPLAPGFVLAGKYEIEEPIGKGGSGWVFAARNILLNDRVAIKLLYDATDKDRDRLIREAQAAVRIRSEHVVRVFDVDQLKGVGPYIVMEYLEGEDLARAVKRQGPLAPVAAADCMVQACEALAIAHDLGIVHRDLKPANLFLTQRSDGSPIVKILDFGISKSADSDIEGLTSTHAVFGTPAFMSPEQLRSTRDVDHRTDIWALGAILHYLLTGELPFSGESPAEMAAKILRDDAPTIRKRRPGLPELADTIIQRCLRKDPAGRFKSASELMLALEPLCSVRMHELIHRTASSTTRRLHAAMGPTPEVSPFVETLPPDATGTHHSWIGPKQPVIVARPSVSPARYVTAMMVTFASVVVAGLAIAIYFRSTPQSTAAPVASTVVAPPPAPPPRTSEERSRVDVTPTETPAPATSSIKRTVPVALSASSAKPSPPPVTRNSAAKPYADPSWAHLP